MSSDMAERCGAAMMRTQAGRKLTSEFTDDEIRDFVRAAIEAMREPTEAMLSNTVDKHGTPRILDFTRPEERDQAFLMARYSWRAMIDAALQESSHVR